MTRRITLPLGSTTNETHCGDCRLRNGTACWAYDRWLPRQPWSGWLDGGWLRLADCRAAEVKDEEVGDDG